MPCSSPPALIDRCYEIAECVVRGLRDDVRIGDDIGIGRKKRTLQQRGKSGRDSCHASPSRRSAVERYWLSALNPDALTIGPQRSYWALIIAANSAGVISRISRSSARIRSRTPGVRIAWMMISL